MCIRDRCTVTVTEDDKLITNDRFYTDTDGNILYSQGGGIFKFPGDDQYYWYGVRYKEADVYKRQILDNSTDASVLGTRSLNRASIIRGQVRHFWGPKLCLAP